MGKKADQEIFELMEIMKESRIDELRLEMPGFMFHAVKNPRKEFLRPAGVTSEEARARNQIRAIVSPRLGFFRRAEKRGGPFLAAARQKVEEKDVVGFIQVLENAYPVSSGVRGTIERVLAEDGKMVEFNQPLFMVAEDKKKIEEG